MAFPLLSFFKSVQNPYLFITDDVIFLESSTGSFVFLSHENAILYDVSDFPFLSVTSLAAVDVFI